MKLRTLTITTMATMLIGSAQAVLIDLPAVNGFGYFRDTQSGYTWMDLNNYRGLTYGEIRSALVGTGFHIATETEVRDMTISAGSADDIISITGGMGGIPWGVYETPSSTYFLYSAWYHGNPSDCLYGQWFITERDQGVAQDSRLVGYPGIWIVNPTSSSVPDRSNSILLFGAAFGLLAISQVYCRHERIGAVPRR